MKDPNSGSVRDCEPADDFHPEANVDITDVDPRMLYQFEEHSNELMKSLFSEMQRRQEELEKQNEKLRQSQKDLIASRSRYYDLYDSAPVAYLIVDVTGSILEANSAARSLLAAAQGSLVGLPFSSFIFADDGELFQSHRKQLEISGESQSCSLRLKGNDGIPKWVRLLSRIEVTREGEAMLRIALIDLTDQMQAELARFESEQRFGFAIEATRDGIWDWNIQTGQVYYSPQWARLLGFDPTEIRPQVDTFFELIHPEDVKQVTEQLQLHFAGDTTEKQTEVRLRTKSGEYRWFFDHGKVVARDQKGAPIRMVGTIKDVTDRKKAELRQKEIASRLLEQESRLRKAQAISKIGNFHWDKITDQVEWSDELYRVYGRDPKSFKPSFAGYIEGVHPDDRQRVMQSLQHAMENLG